MTHPIQEPLMSAQVHQQIHSLNAKLELVLATLEAVCKALPEQVSANAAELLTHRAQRLATNTLGATDKAQLAVLAPVLAALTRSRPL